MRIRRGRNGFPVTFTYKDRMPDAKKDFARDLRRRMTVSEKLIWDRVRRDALGVSIRRQVPMLGWIVDFYCPAVHLVIEVDGGYHVDRQAADAKRDSAMRRHGFRVLRLTAESVERDPDGAVEIIRRAIG